MFIGLRHFNRSSFSIEKGQESKKVRKEGTERGNRRENFSKERRKEKEGREEEKEREKQLFGKLSDSAHVRKFMHFQTGG